MATKQPPYKNTSPSSTEFEFPLSSNPLQREADELFYNGRLLPLLHNPVNDDYVADSDTRGIAANISRGKKSWSMRESNIGLKLKASRAYVKSLFTKSDESKVRACSSGYLKPPKDTLVRRIAEEESVHWKSFSRAINHWHSARKASLVLSSCSSSPSSFSIANSEADSPIEGAIAHCKKSQQPARRSM